jgi:hypothetical protein
VVGDRERDGDEPAVSRAPDLVVELSSAAHPSRTARKELRRFLAPRAVALVHDAGVATAEVVRQAAQHRSGTLQLCAWFDDDSSTLRVEVHDGDPSLTRDGFPIVAALAAEWGTETRNDGAVVWFEMRRHHAGQDRRGRSA